MPTLGSKGWPVAAGTCKHTPTRTGTKSCSTTTCIPPCRWVAEEKRAPSVPSVVVAMQALRATLCLVVVGEEEVVVEADEEAEDAVAAVAAVVVTVHQACPLTPTTTRTRTATATCPRRTKLQGACTVGKALAALAAVAQTPSPKAAAKGWKARTGRTSSSTTSRTTSRTRTWRPRSHRSGPSSARRYSWTR